MGTLRLVATSSSGAGGLCFARRLHIFSCEFSWRPISSVNLSQFRSRTSGCSRRENLVHVAAAASSGTCNNSDSRGSRDDEIRCLPVDVDAKNTDRKLLEGKRNQEQVNPSLVLQMFDKVKPVGLGRRTRHLLDELWRKLFGLIQFSVSSGDRNVDTLLMTREGEGGSWEFIISDAQNTRVFVVDANSSMGCELMRRVYRVKNRQETDFVLVSCAGLGMEPNRREKVLKAKKVAHPPDKKNNCNRLGSSTLDKNSSYRGGAMAGVVVNLLAAAVVLSTLNPQAQALARPVQTQLNDPNQETLSNIPPFLSPSSPSESKSSQIQHPKSRKAESCTVKCLNTCIRGEDGVGPLNVRRPLVVFKPGFRSRKYCLVECSDICNLIKDGDDGP